MVVQGCSLHVSVQGLSFRFDQGRHRHPELGGPYGPHPPLTLRPDGPLAALAKAAGIAGPLMVNSLHWQGLDRIAAGLTVEAEAEDGTPEAVSVSGAKVFALGVQWHPEYKAWENPFSRELFEAFGTAARRRAGARSSEDVFTLADLERK